MPIPVTPAATSGGFAFGETVVRLRAVVVLDPYSGEPVALDWTDPDQLDINGCAFAPGGSEEPLEQGRNAVVTSPTVYAPTGADVEARDRLVIRGRTWDVDGDPADWRHPMTGWMPGVVIPLKEVAG